MEILHFRAAGVSVVIECPPDALPAILHWGPDLGALDDEALAHLAADLRPRLDVTRRRARTGPAGARGAYRLDGHARPVRAPQGTELVPRLTGVPTSGTGQTLTATARDEHARLDLTITVELGHSGLLRARADLRNQPESPYTLDAL